MNIYQKVDIVIIVNDKGCNLKNGCRLYYSSLSVSLLCANYDSISHKLLQHEIRGGNLRYACASYLQVGFLKDLNSHL